MPILDEFSSPALAGVSSPGSGGQAFGVASMGFSILGGILKGMSDIQAGNFNANIARRNAQIADMAGGDALLRGNAAAGNLLLRGDALKAKQTQAFAGAGVSVSSGSAMDVLSGTDTMSALDAQTIRNNSMREAWGYKNTATNFRQKAEIDEANGRSQAVGDILGGVTGSATYGAKMLSIA